MEPPKCNLAATPRASKSAGGVVGSSEGVESPKRGAPKGSARPRSDGMGTVETGVGARDMPVAAAKGCRRRGTRGGGSTREEDTQRTLPGRTSQSTAGRSESVSAAVRRRARVEMQPVGSSAPEASGWGVGARGGNSGGVAPKGTAKIGVKVTSAAGHSGARPRRSSPVPTKVETRVGDSLGGSRKLVNPHT